MFNSLDEQIEEAEGSTPSSKRQMLRVAGFVALAAVIFIGLYMAIRLL